ncbi:hypothetical protein BJF79_28920 [Actinomadura sp. CNU-125]|uniref:hypothetical protein n=1 Tax=Actinomadura sp. CNU-125 TaxID=1904961 RepID=UPI00095B8B0F|nr:hypothetical protein [Actinomadura sp. CNU-125]OLT37826.1 hypothetical protein BJF79_28920 [Actinomadura sp. CNU-125]
MKLVQQNRRSHRTPRRDRSVRFSLSEDEHAVVVAAAKAEKLAVGAFAAQSTLEAARGTARPEYAVLRHALGAVLQAVGQARRIGVNFNQVVAALHSGETQAEVERYAEEASRTVRRLDELGEQLRRRLP